MPRLNGLWHQHDFLKFWLSDSLSLLSLQFGNLAFPLVAIVTLHASAAQLGLLAGIGRLPWFLFGLVAGIGIDRRRRRPILVIAHLGRAGLAGSVPVAALFGVLSMAQLYIVAFGVGALGLGFETAYHSYLPSLVSRDELADGNSKLAVTSGLTRMAGPSLAGVAVEWLTPVFAYGLNTLSFLIAGLLVWRIRRHEPQPPHHDQASVWTAFRAGLQFTWRQMLIRAFTLSEGTYQFFFSVMQAVLLVFFTRTLDLGPERIGLIFSVGSVGGLLGAVVARHTGERFALGPTVISGSLVRALGLVGVPLAAVTGSFAVPILVVARLINAFGWTVWQVHQETTQQLVTPNELRGRVTGSSLFLIRSLEAGGGFAAAALAARLGVVAIVAIGAVGALVSTGWLMISPLRQLRVAPRPAQDPAADVAAARNWRHGEQSGTRTPPAT